MERIDELNIKGAKIIQNTDYFLFGMDSVLLSNMVEGKKTDILVDLGTGSAVMPIIIALKKRIKNIVGIELQSPMYDLACRNVILNNLDNTINTYNLDLRDYKKIKEIILNKYKKDGVDIVISNPPYKKQGTGVLNNGDVKYIARHEEKCHLEDIFKTSSKILRSKGKLYLVHKPDRLPDAITLGRKYNLELKTLRLVQPTVLHKPSIALMMFVKDGGLELNIEPSLIQKDENGNTTQEIWDIYGSNERK